MRSTARLVLVLFMLIAIPFKGAIAANMVMCGPGHDRETSTIATATESAAGDQTPSQARDHGTLRHIDSANILDDADAADDDPESLARHDATKCNICAACCIGGVILSSNATQVPALAGTEMSFPSLEVHFLAFVLAGLERPPRSILV